MASVQVVKAWGRGPLQTIPKCCILGGVAEQSSIPRALIIGAGIAGMQASLDIANAGYDVILVDRLPSIGGHMAQLSETFPTLDCAQCILTPRTVEVGHHEHIHLHTYSEVEAVEGAIGDFRVRIRRHATYVDWGACTGCGTCQEKCPRRVISDFERGVGTRKAIYTLSPQAVPNKPVIDREHCIFFQRGKCRACERLCPVGAIAFDQQDSVVEERVGAIVVATGYDLYALSRLPEYGSGRVPDVIEAHALECEARKLKVSFDSSDSPAIHGDPFLIRQAIDNLYRNALDFSPPGGTILVKVRALEGCTFIEISDQGPGIPDYVGERVFERFFSLPRPETGQKSTGLGLNFAREVAELHNGSLVLENREPGIRARLSLPHTNST